jgi:hypothetical protein
MNRELKRLLEDVARGEIGPAISARARGLLAPRKRVARDVGPDRKAQRKDERRKRMADIREAVMVRAEGRCEVCGDEAAHAHHILSGPDRRRHEEVATMLALCPACHRRIHAGDVSTLEHATTYCAAHEMVRAAFALGKRMAKIAEARAPRGGRQEGRTG